MSVGPVCQTLLSTGLSEWELGPHHTEQSPIHEVILFFMCFLTTSNHHASFDFTIHRLLEPKVAAEFLPQLLIR